jgi:antitoxin (DNA-binding transcriptional repressor) of toxin-antitoxin stability system
MKTATVAELHEHLDEYLELVRGGEIVEIRDEKEQVARLLPALSGIDKDALIASGRLRAPQTTDPLPDDFFTEPRPKFPNSVLRALLEEREEGW